MLEVLNTDGERYLLGDTSLRPLWYRQPDSLLARIAIHTPALTPYARWLPIADNASALVVDQADNDPDAFPGDFDPVS